GPGRMVVDVFVRRRIQLPRRAAQGVVMLAARRVEPEWLDELPPDDPRAQRSRRDLARVNTLMANARMVPGELGVLPFPAAIAELGAGDGDFALRVVRILGPAAGRRITLLDRAPLVGEDTLARFAALGWTAKASQADVIAWLADVGTPRFDVIFANLFLHHF